MPTNRGLVKKTKGIWTYNTRVILKNEEYFYTNMGGKIPKLYVRLSSKKKKKKEIIVWSIQHAATFYKS